MANPFATDRMSIGYAESRPPVHRLVVERAARAMGATGGRVLDIGSGSGLSTRALEGLATERVGVEPAASMAAVATGIVRDAHFVAGAAEAMPFRSHAFDWMTAAGSLNYVALDPFFSEARRVMRPDGSLVVYDFSPGRTMTASPALDAWFDSFIARYPWKPSEALFLDPARLAELGQGWRVQSSEHFEIPVALTRDFYVRYMMTESNVAYALRRGVEESSIRAWIEETLPTSGWGDILFRGYWAIMRVWN